jgi:lysophospholipase L1-like esterase
MPVKARQGGTGRVRGGRPGAQQGGGSSPGSPTGVPVFQADFTALSSLPAQISLSRASIGTRFNSSGVMVTEAVDGPRFDYAWNGSAWVSKGLLIEDQRTNFTLQSEDSASLNGGPTSGTTVTSNTTVALDGNTTADTIALSAGGYIYRRVVVGTGGTYTLSVFLKASSNTSLALRATEDSVVQTVINVTTTFQRFNINISISGSGSGILDFGLDTRTLAGADGNAHTVIAWGWDIELGSFPTSYIPTIAAVTRSADIVQLAGTAQTVFTGSACAVIMEIDAPVEAGILSGGYFYANFLRDSTGGGAAALRHYGNTLDGIASHAPDGSEIHTTLLSGDLTTPFRCGIAFDATGRSISSNGSTAVSAAPVVGQTTPIYLGFPQTGIAAGLDTCLRKIEMYSSRLSDALLATFTKMDSPNGVAWGDSLTAGFNASSAAAAYPQVLSGLLGRDVGNGGVGGETSTQITTRALADILDANRIALIWMGLNDTDGNSANTSAIISTILSNITSVINHMSGQTQRFAVMSLLTGDTEFPGATAPGDGFYTQKLAINSALASAYPSNYLDIRSLLISASGGTYFPGASYRSDTIHLNDTGYAYVAAQVKAFINSKGW